MYPTQAGRREKRDFHPKENGRAALSLRRWGATRHTWDSPGARKYARHFPARALGPGAAGVDYPATLVTISARVKPQS
ncbi:MAG: hypothetical protein ACRD9R_02865 [Pyrinomonadaceae bacterium]